jgi:subtilase family serine protease
VYNTTSLYASGVRGSGETIGLLDFFGSPTIESDLKAFDSAFGFPDANLVIVPIGPYDPNLGANVGWSTEVSLDVESSHAMAPAANIRMYVANGALSLSSALAKIVQDDSVTVLSQSFGNPEWLYSLTDFLGGPNYFTENALMADQYYALGSVEGITFLASSGDAGGSGYSSGPEGGVEYPSSSPFVTSVGGTQTYFSDNFSSFREVAWSSQGFVPNIVNEGGSGGGVSILEPRPWYQQGLKAPQSFPDGRLNPDISLQAGAAPATMIVDSGQTIQTGGTSESTQLFAGIVALMAESNGGTLGLLNPFLYKVGNDSSLYPRAYQPITSGFNIPWTASYGYNLVTGWGAPNAGELSGLVSSFGAVPALTIDGTILNAGGAAQLDYTKGQTLNVEARITAAGQPVSGGNFRLDVEPLQDSILSTPLAYSPSTKNWTGSVVIGDQAGVVSVEVSGSSGSLTGEAMGTAFAGYLGTIEVQGSPYIAPIDPWDWNSTNPLSILVYATTLDGVPAPISRLSLGVQPYSILSNTYSTAGTVTLSASVFLTGEFDGGLNVDVPAGPVSLVAGSGVYSYAPLINGIYFQNGYIFPQVAVEPGSVAPGQSLTIIESPIAPANLYFFTSYETGRYVGQDVAVGSNVTASLVDPSGRRVSSSKLSFMPCAQALRVCQGGASMLNGYLPVPLDSAPGLYTVMLDGSYGSYSINSTIHGSFFGQVLVSGGPSVPKITMSPQPLYEGQTATLTADIAYPNGTEVKYGVYTAVVYPQELQGAYTKIMHTEYASSSLIPLQYNLTLNLWSGTFSLPSPYDPGAISQVSNASLYYAGPYDAFVAGQSYDGFPTTSDLQAQQPFYIQPYIHVGGLDSISPSQSSGLAFEGVTFDRPANLSGDVFLGTNTILGTSLTISESQIQGTLVLQNSRLTLTGVSGGNVSAQNSSIVLDRSRLMALILDGSTVSLADSVYGTVTPPLPAVVLTAPVGGGLFNGTSVVANVTGTDVSEVSLYLDGTYFASLQGNGTLYSFPLNATALEDGVHSVQVVAMQEDGLNSSVTTTFSTNARLLAEKRTLDALQGQLKSDEDTIGSLQATQSEYVLLLGLLAAAGVVLAVGALLRGRRRPAPPQPGKPTSPSYTTSGQGDQGHEGSSTGDKAG